MEKLLDLLLSLQDVFKISLGFFLGLFAFNYQEAQRERKEARNAISFLFQETKLNQILCTLMIDDQQFKLFDVDALNKFKYNPLVSVSKEIVHYMIFIDCVNSNIADYLNFKRFYTSDSENRTSENEKVLHTKRSRAIENLKEFQKTLAAVRDDVKTQLDKLKITPRL